MKSINTGLNNTAEEVAKILLKVGAISLRPANPFRYASGILSPVYTDCRLLISNPKERKEIIGLYIKSIKKTRKTFQVVAGTSTAGIPHAAWIADSLNLPMIYVRGNAKDHGKGNQIEGTIKKGQTAIIIEDLISTGKSSIETANAIRKKNAKINTVFAIITYGMKIAKDNFKSNKIDLIPLATFEDVVNQASKMKFIKQKDKAAILEWVKDPASWGKKMGFE